jgi:hypothetical protein
MADSCKRSKLVFAGLVVLFAAVCGEGSRTAICLADEPNQKSSPKPAAGQAERGKTAALREVAQNWISVGISQYNRGFYPEAEKSLLTARDYQEYLTADEREKLEEYLAKAHQTSVDRQAVLEHIKEARNLLSQGRPVEARAHYEKVRNNPYLTELERKQITAELQTVDANFDKHRKEITELYNRSVEFYRAGKLEKARQGFVEVAGYGLLVAPKGQSAEDYLLQIDNILAERFKGKSPAESAPPPVPPVASPPVSTKAAAVENKPEHRQAEAGLDINQQAPPNAESGLLQTGSQQPLTSEIKVKPQPPENEQDANQQPQNSPEEIIDVAKVAEPAPKKSAEVTPATDTKAKIIRAYTKAVVDDAAVKVGYYIGRREFDKAIAAVRAASEVVSENRSLIGDELFTQYTVRLKQLADRIIQLRKTS